MNRPADATPILERLAAADATAAPAGVRLARLDYDSGDKAGAYARLDAILAKHRELRRCAHHEGALADGRGASLQRRSSRRRRRSAAEPSSAIAQYVLGSVHASLKHNDEAKAAFGEVLKLNPRAAAAQTALAGLNLAAGSTDSAVQFARDALVNPPGNAMAQLLLVRGLLAKGDINRAQSEITALLTPGPDDPNVRAVNGTLLLLKKDHGGRAPRVRAGAAEGSRSSSMRSPDWPRSRLGRPGRSAAAIASARSSRKTRRTPTC